MIYDIKRNNTIIASVRANGWQTRQAMGVNIVDMDFVLNTPVEFQIGDYCIVYGEKYFLNIKPEMTKENERLYFYRLQLEHEYYSLQKIKLLALDYENKFTEENITLTGTLSECMDLVLYNANRIQSGWIKGAVEETEIKTVQFSSVNVLQAINQLALEFETEYWIEGKTINMVTVNLDSGITLSYGKNKGLKSLTKGNKENTSIFTRLYVKGGSRNILPTRYRNGSQNLRLPDGFDYIENQNLVSEYGVIEEYIVFEDIFPNRIGTVTSVDSPFVFSDSAMDFDVNEQLQPGVVAKVSFITGDLAGYEFTLSAYDNVGKKFTINKNEDEKVIEIPSDAYNPKVGDQYIILDIIMPETYVTQAEQKLLDKANEHYNKGSDITFNDKYIGDCDSLYFKRNDITPELGDKIRLFEVNPPIDVFKRVSEIKRDLQDEWDYELEFTDDIKVSEVAKVFSEAQKLKRLREKAERNEAELNKTKQDIILLQSTWELVPVSDKQVNAFNYDVTGTLNTLVYSVKFMRGGKDVTAIMQQSGLNLYNFERKNTYGFDDNNVSDASWNAAHVGAKTVTLTDKDIYAVGTLEVVYDETILENEYKILTNGN